MNHCFVFRCYSYSLIVVLLFVVHSARTTTHNTQHTTHNTQHTTPFNTLITRIIMHYALKCQEQGLPVSQAIQRYCAQLQADEIFISEEDKTCIAQELLEHFEIVQTYLRRVYKTWMAAGSIPEQYRALTRAAGCDTASVLQLIANIRQDLIGCCNQYGIDFSGTWTALAELQTDITTCCSTQQANFVSTWTIINSLSPAGSVCGPVTAITQSDIDPVNGYTISTPGNYCLAEDIVYNGPDGTSAITINASNVSFSMNNHEIQVNNDESQTVNCIQVNDRISNITIIKGTFTGGSQGIQLGSSNSTTIERCVFQNQQSAGLGGAGNNNIIAHCIFRSIDGLGIHYSNSENLAIHNCNLILNSINATAISIFNSSNISIQNCITGQVLESFTFHQSSNATLNNCIASNGTNGVSLIQCTTGNIQSCLIRKNGNAGILLSNSSNCIFTECYIYQNPSAGILFSNTNVTDCLIDRCISSGGISVAGSSNYNNIIQSTLCTGTGNGVALGNHDILRQSILLTNIVISFNNALVEDCVFNRPCIANNNTKNSIVRNNEAFSCVNTCFVNNADTSNVFYSNNAFNAGSPAYSLSITNTFNVNTPDPLTGTVGDVLRNLTNTN